MPGNEPVYPFGEGRDTRNLSVQPEGPPVARRVSQETKDRFRPLKELAIRKNKLDRGIELLLGNSGKLAGDFLERSVLDLLFCQWAPSVDPPQAKTAVHIVDQQWLRSRRHGPILPYPLTICATREGEDLKAIESPSGHGVPNKVRDERGLDMSAARHAGPGNRA